MSHYKLGAIEVALALARVLPVYIPFGAGLAGTPSIHAHAALINAIKGVVKTVSGNVRDAAVSVVSAVKLAGSVAKLCGRD